MSRTSESLQLCSTCGKSVSNMSAHQRIHRDGIKICTPSGEQRVYRTGSAKFRCQQPGCTYSSEDSCNFQSHTKRHLPPGPYPTPGPSAARLSQPRSLDAIMEDETQSRESGYDTVDEKDVEDPDTTLVNDEMVVDANEGTLDLDTNEDDDIQYSDKNDEDYEDQDDETHVQQARWSEDTIQTDAMAGLGICVNTAARVIVCIACASAIKPLELPEHLAKTHSPISTNDVFSQELVDAYHLRADLDSRPDSIITAVYGLELVDGYLTCDNCGYACKSAKVMRRHTKESKDCTTSQPRPVQTFRPTSKRCYFGVNLAAGRVEEPTEDPLDPLTYLKKRFAPTPFTDTPITSPKSARDANHFLSLEKWDLYVKGKTGAEIAHTVKERNPELRAEVRICVERFAADIAVELSKVDHEVRAAMADYIGIGLATNKFRRLQNEKTRKAYSKVATDLVVYCLGIITGEISEFATGFTQQMADAGTTFLRVLQTTSIADQDAALQDLLYSLFTQKRRGNADKYSLLTFSFLVLYSFTKDGNLQPCNTFTQHFSKIIFFARGALFNRINAQANREDKGFFEVYKTYQDFLLIRHDYPLSPIYSTKNLAKKISGDRERENKVNFTGPENKTAILKNLTVKLETFGDWYWKLLDELKRLQVDLFGGVGFEDEEWLSVTVPDPLLDEPNLSSPGFCFGDVERNDLGRYNDAGLRTLLHHPRLKDRFGAMLPGGRFIPNAVGCHDFLERSSRARSKLATLLHISCGGPARGTELTSHYLRNHPQGDIRNVMVIDGRLCLVAGYNKSSSTTERQKKIYRFLPKSLYRVCILDWFVIRPVEIMLAGLLGLEGAVDELRFLLFPGVYEPFISEVFSKHLKRDSYLHIGQEIGISDFRDLQSNIVDEHRDPEAVEFTTMENVSAIQQGHSSAMASEYYNLRPDRPHGVGREMIKGYLRASQWWQHITGIEPLTASEHKPPKINHHHSDSTALASISTIGSQLQQLSAQIESLNTNVRSSINESIGCALAVQARRSSNIGSSSQVQPELYLPHPSLLRLLRTFLADPGATFKTREQAEAVEFVMAYEHHLFLVGPTAMGKTLVYMLPAANRSDGTTCVLLPLSSLHIDFDRRCKDLKIPSSRWTPQNNKPRTKIVYVSPEHAQMGLFTNYLSESCSLGLLKQFVIDEAHLVKSHEDFRFCFSALKPLLRSGVPFLLMTATCPPPLRSEILSILGIDDCHTIHAPTDRPEISYRVKVFPTLDNAKDELVATVKGQLAHENPNSFRGLVYCRSKRDVDEVAEMLGCNAFHASRPEDERIVSFRNWVEGKQRFMVCSSLMGCGIDVEGVSTVYHLGTPWSILDFVQESGRAGRSGKASLSMVFAAMDEREPDSEDSGDLYGKQMMREWVLQDSMCRRLALSSFLDNGHTTCTLLKSAVLCDVCEAETLKDHPGRLVTFSASMAPTHDRIESITLPTVPPTSLTYETSSHTSNKATRSYETPPETNRGQTTLNDRTRKRGEENMDTNKRPRLSRVDGPVQPLSAGSVDRRTDNPLLEDIERRAIKAIQERRKALPVTASVSITTNIWANEITLEIATQMVHDVRANVKANRRGCSVCYMISGEEVTDHKSGARCRKMPLTSTTSGWSDFKDNLYFVDGVLCWHCLLPTNEKSNMPGAVYHLAIECTDRHFIRPALFAFYEYGLPDLKEFVSENLGACVWEKGIEEYSTWLTAPSGNDIPNHLKLYWWILMFWRRLPR